MKKKKYFLDTLGCYPARIDSERIKVLLKKNNWTLSEGPEKADIIIINTCAFSEDAENRSIRAIKKYKEIKTPKAKLIVGGCLPIINKRRMLTVFKGPYFTPHTISSLCKVIKAKHCNIDEMPTAQPILTDTNTFSNKEEKAFCIRLGYGCRCRCSFCVVNRVFPKLVSKNKEQIVKEFKSGLKQGYQNFLLTGEDPSVYGFDIGTNLTELLKELISIKTRKKIAISLYRLSPQWLKFDSDFIKILKSKKINYLSIPVNSGSKRIIKLMNRKYDLKEIKNNIKNIKNKFPFIKINLDLMAGFPGETEKDFQDTLKFVSETKPDNIRVFLFTDRPHAKAKYLGKEIPLEIMKKRAEQLYQACGIKRRGLSRRRI